MQRLLFAFGLTGALGLWAPAGAVAQKGDPNVLTAAEIASKPELTNAYDVIKSLRPKFLRTRPSTIAGNYDRGLARDNPNEPVLYVNGTRREGLRDLRDIPAATIEEVRFLYPNEAVTQYGSGHEVGALLITLKRG